MDITIIEPRVIVESVVDGSRILRNLERIGRTCWKSEGKICEGSAEVFVKKLMDRKHESVLEHERLTVRFIVDRAVAYELLRHRLGPHDEDDEDEGAATQESTRYVNSDKRGFVFIRPFWYGPNNDKGPGRYANWEAAMRWAANWYSLQMEFGEPPQYARSCLPNSLKTELVRTFNIRQWRHILNLRTDKAAHPQMRQVMVPLAKWLKSRVPVLFDDINEGEHECMAEVSYEPCE